jgi:RNA polymerase sigma factor (sigma-70 family)
MATAPLSRILGHLRLSGDDGDLLQEFLATSDSAVFAAIVRRHGPTVLAACRQVLRHEADVEDAFQATFLVLFRSAAAIRKGQSLGSWLFGVAHRVSVNAKCRRVKREGRERTNEEPPHPADEAPDLSWREASAILHEELNRLPDKLRLPLLLCYLEGKSRDEAAEHLGWSAGVVKGALERGRLRLRARLTRRGIALSAGLLAAVDTTPSAAAPPSWVDSVVSFVCPGTVRPAVSILARGVSPMTASTRFWAATLCAAVLIGAGSLIAASTSPDPTPKKNAPVSSEAPKLPAEEKLVVSGKVLDAQSTPIAGAKLYVPYLKRTPPTSEDDIGTEVVGETAADGSYKVEIEKTEITRYLVVGAVGHAVGWVNLEKATGATEGTIKLARDLIVEGRVIDTEGKPAAGATIRVMSVYVPADGKLDSFLTGWKNDWSDALRLVDDRMYLPLESVHGNGKADKDGKFTLKGIGADRIAHVDIVAPGYAKSTVYVITQAGLDAGPLNKAASDKIPPELRIPGQPPTLSGPKVEMVIEGTKMIEGTVTDAQTGKPFAGLSIASGTGYGAQVSVTSDKDGKYQLTGLVKQRHYLLHTMVRDEKSTSYLMWSARIDDTEGLAPIRHDIQMTRGVVVAGRLIDRTTGKGVRGSIRLAPLADNKYFGTKPAYNGYSSERFSHQADNDGKFRVVTIPGTSVIMAQANAGESVGGKPINPFLRSIPDPDHAKYFTPNGEDGHTIAAAGNSLEFLDNTNACKVVDLKPDAGEVKIDLYLERGKTLELKVVDSDGKPLEGATVAGLTASWPVTYRLAKDTATVYGLETGKARTILLMHPEKKLGTSVVIKADEKEPVIAKLSPLGSVFGKLTDTDGQPISGVMVGIQFPNGPGGELYREVKLTQTAPVTDKDGTFRVDGIVPGVKFYLSMNKGRAYYVGEPRIGLRQVDAGQALDMGNLKVKGQVLGQ